MIHRILQNETVSEKKTVEVFGFDDEDGFTEKTGLNLSGRVIKGDGTAAAAAGTFTEREFGRYAYEFSTAELDQAGFIFLRVTNAAMKTFYFHGQVGFNDPFRLKDPFVLEDPTIVQVNERRQLIMAEQNKIIVLPGNQIIKP